MFLDLVHLRLVEPALGIGRQAVGSGVGLDVRHRKDSADRERGTGAAFLATTAADARARSPTISENA